MPIVLWNLLGTLSFCSALGFLQKAGHGPGAAAGFAGAAALLFMGRTMLFVVGLILCCVAHPRIENLRWPSVVSSILLCSSLLSAMIWQARRFQPVQVVDSTGKPIPQIRIHFNSGEDDGFGIRGVVKTDSDGKAMICGFKTQRLNLNVEAKDYYVPNGERNVFVDLQNLNGKIAAVANFHLHKKGEGVDLVTSQYGIANDFQIHIPRDGTPIKVDFMQRKIDDNGQMQITESKPEFKNWKQATNWWFRMEISDDGFIEENDEFPFTAPDTGYTNVVEFNFQKDQPDWTTDINTNYYIKFGNPPLYGHLHIQTGISYGGAILKYAINPTGSRNLEPK